MEYFCAYHSMLGATRKLSDAECGRLFRALLAYSSGEQLINLQGREELLFDVFSQQIDRDRERYEKKCVANKNNGSKANGTDRHRPLPTATVRTQEKEKDKDKEELPPTPSNGDAPYGGGAAYVENNLRGMTAGNWDELRSYMEDGIGMDLVRHAVDEAAAQGKRTWAYVRRILNRYLTEGIETVEQAKTTDGKSRTAGGAKIKWVGDDE